MKSLPSRPPEVSLFGRSPVAFDWDHRPYLRSAWWLLLSSTALIFAAVVPSIFILYRLEGFSRETEVLIQGAVLCAFLFPGFYLLLFRPLHLQMLRLKKAEDEIRTLAFYDSLTGLPNRVLLRDRAGQAFALARRENRSMAVIFLDLDDFKQVNDRFGHAAGDDFLRAVAGKLSQSVRETDTVARIGGDEFVWVGMVGDFKEAEAIARKILQNLTKTIFVADKPVKIGASIGIAVHPRDGDDLDALIRTADGAMYDAKKGGKNCFHSSESRHYCRSEAHESAYSYFRD